MDGNFDDKGKVICYSGQELEGNYIIIDAATYAEGRPDIRVIDGKISKASTSAIVQMKLWTWYGADRVCLALRSVAFGKKLRAIWLYFPGRPPKRA